MKRILVPALVAAIALSSAATGKNIDLRYCPDLSEELGRPNARIGQARQIGGSRKPDLTAEPDYKSDKPGYIIFPREGYSPGLVIVADESKGTGQGYDTLYVDANGNLDLTDDPQMKKAESKVRRLRRGVAFAPVNVPIRIGETGIPCHVSFTVMTYPLRGRGNVPMCGMILKGGFAGVVKLKKEHKIILADSNLDGVLGGKSIVERIEEAQANNAPPGPIPMGGDMMYVDLDGDGRISTSYRSKERLPYGCGIRIEGSFVRLKPAEDMKTLSTAPSSKKMGRLTLADHTKEAMVLSRDALITLDEDTDTTECPAGKYYLLTCKLEKPDSKGRWMFRGRGLTSGQAFEVEPGKSTTLALGPPIRTGVTIRSAEVKDGSTFIDAGSKVGLSLSLTGRAGETYSAPLRYSKKGKASRPKAPTFNVKDSKGGKIAAGSFEYG